jgi:uncharacterized protein YggU (UPF0235/DUF167 family)
VRFEIHVRPNASATSVGGAHDGALVVRVTAPPSEGRATSAALRAVAEALDVPSRAVTLVRGATSRRKLLDVAVPKERREQVERQLTELVSQP